MGKPGLPLGLVEVCTIKLEEEIHCFPVAIILIQLQHNETIKK